MIPAAVSSRRSSAMPGTGGRGARVAPRGASGVRGASGARRALGVLGVLLAVLALGLGCWPGSAGSEASVGSAVSVGSTAPVSSVVSVGSAGSVATPGALRDGTGCGKQQRNRGDEIVTTSRASAVHEQLGRLVFELSCARSGSADWTAESALLSAAPESGPPPGDPPTPARLSVLRV